LPRETARKLIKRFKTSDPFELASYENIKVIPWNLDEEIQGFYKYVRRNKFIFYNSNIVEPMKKFVCAHELGHALLHPRSSTPFMREKTLFSVDRIEVEANTFAVEVLLPDKLIETYKHTKRSIEEIAVSHGIPKEIARLKRYENHYFF